MNHTDLNEMLAKNVIVIISTKRVPFSTTLVSKKQPVQLSTEE